MKMLLETALPRVLETLQWFSSSEFQREVDAHQREYCSQQFDIAFKRLRHLDESAWESLSKLRETLVSERSEKVICSPESHGLLFALSTVLRDGDVFPVDPFYTFYWAGFLAEHNAQTGTGVSDFPIQSVLGEELRFDGATGTAFWHASHLGTSVIDFTSPYALVDLRSKIHREPATCEPPHAYLGEDRTQAVGLLDDAWDAIGRAAPHCQSFTTRFLAQICVRRDPHVDRLVGTSIYCFPRRVILGNVHLLRPHVAIRIAESLVHEAIHSFLYCLDLPKRCLFIRDEEAPYLTSPWTGNRIRTSSFVHATFVWFGLWHFYEHMRHGEVDAVDYIKEKQRMIFQGFSSQGFDGLQKRYRSPYTNEIMEALSECRRLILAQ